MADAAEPPAADPDFDLKHLAHTGAEGEIGVAHDALRDAARAIAARSAHRSDAVDEFDLADRRHLRPTVLLVHRAAFEEHGGDDVVTTADVREQLGQQITPALRRVPEMMVRVDDRQIRLQHRLGRPPGQPCCQLSIIAIGDPAVFSSMVSGLPKFTLFPYTTPFNALTATAAA